MEKKEEVNKDSNNNNKVNQIKDTIPQSGEINLQMVNTHEIKTKDQIEEQIIKTNIIKDDNEVKQEEVVDKIIGSANTLQMKHLVDTVFEQSLETPIFSIQVPDCTFKKYLISKNYSCGEQIVGISDLSPLYAHSFDPLGFGVYIHPGHRPNYSSLLYFKPGVTNLVVVNYLRNQQYIDVDLALTESQILPSFPGFQTNEVPESWFAKAEWVLWRDTQAHQTHYQSASLLYGGSSCVDNGFVFKIDVRDLTESNLSFTTEMVNMWNQINRDPGMPNQLLEPMRRVNLATGNIQYRDVLVYLYNQAYKDNLCYSPIVEQLKIGLYTDMLTTMFDMVEGLSQMGKRGFDRWVYNSSGIYELIPNRQAGHTSALGCELIACTWQQWMDITNGANLAHDQNYDMRKPWVPVPIKRDMLRDSEGMLSLILGLLPYPMFGVHIPISSPEDPHVDPTNGKLTTYVTDAWAEHCAARVRIEGYRYIMLVLIDSIQGDPDDPNQPAYAAFWNIRVFGQDFLPLNPLNLPQQAGMNMDVKAWIIQLSDYLAAEITDKPMLLIDAWSRITHWNFYMDIFNMVAYLATMNGMHYGGWWSIAARLHTECLPNFIPAISLTNSGFHMTLGLPSFFQRLYAIIGFVRQKGADFIGSFSKIDFCEMMMAKRYAFITLKGYLLDVKRNELRVVFPGLQTAPLDSELETRRIQMAIMYNKYLKWAPELNLDKSLYGLTGFIRYIRGNIQPGTYMEVWNDTWTDINEYVGLEDWCNFMTHDLLSIYPRITRLNEPIISKNFIVEHETNLYVFTPKNKQFESFLGLNEILNDLWGRSHYMYFNVGGGAKFNYIPLQYHDRGPSFEVYEPFWHLGLWTWLSDKTNFIPRTPAIIYNNIPLAGGMAFAPQYPWPLVRVLDYVYPGVRMYSKKLLAIIMADLYINAPLIYVNISVKNQFVITVKDLVNRQAYPKLTE